MKFFSTMFRRLTGYLDNPKLIDETIIEYDGMTAGTADPTLIPPTQAEGRLGVVPAKYEKLLLDKFSGVHDKDGWRVPENLDWELVKKLKPLWIKTPVDLIADKTPTRLTAKGEPITNFVLVEDYGKGGESTAIPLILASLPMFTALLLFARHAGQHISGWLGLGVSVVPILGILAGLLALEEMFSISKMVKSFLIGVVMPYVMLTVFAKGFHIQDIIKQNNPVVLGAGGILLVLGLIWFLSTQGGGTGKNGHPALGEGQAGMWHRGLDGFKAMIWWFVVFGGLDFAINHLPPAFHAAIWFIPGCLMAVRHADHNWRYRIEEILQQEQSGKLMRTMNSFNPNGPVLGTHRNQIIRAARDTSPMIYYGVGTGALLNKFSSPLFIRKGQPVGMSVHDQSTHFMGLGVSGSGKTTSIARTDLYQWIRKACGGALVEDGKGQLPFDLEPLIDIKIKPGFNWAPVQGMDGIQLGAALKAFKPSGKAVKDSDENGSNAHWNDGANLVIKHVVYLHYQLHRHEIAIRATARIKSAQLAAKLLTFDIQEMDGADVSDIRDKAFQTQADCSEELETKRIYRWTYGGVWRTMNACNEIIHQPNNVKLIGKTLTAMKGFLGVTVGQSTLSDKDFNRIQREEPEKIHAEAQQIGSSLLEALDYIDHSYVGLADDTRTSFWGNIAQMFSPLMSTGTVFCNAEGIPWVEIEQGETLADVFTGKIAGVFLNTDLYGSAALIVNQLARFFVYSGLRRRDDNWAQDPTQTRVKIMIDECHMLIGQAETDLITTLRSKGGTFFFLTQGIGQLLSTAGFRIEEAYALLDQFATICALQSDHDTVEYLARRVPMVWVTGGTQMKYSGSGLIDVESAVSQLANSPLEQKDLEGYSHYQKMERAGWGNIMLLPNAQAQQGHSEAKKLLGPLRNWHAPYRTIDASGGATMFDEDKNPVLEKLVPAITANEIKGALNTKGDGTALWIANRAGTTRIDIVHLPGMSAKDVRDGIAAGTTP
jgi:hypothetical protein